MLGWTSSHPSATRECVHDGTRILGAPIGSVQVQADFASCRVAEICVDLNTINLMPSLQQQSCLADGSTIYKINLFANYMHWNLPGGEISLVDPVAAVYDNAILHAPWRLTGRPSLPFLALTLPSPLGAMVASATQPGVRQQIPLILRRMSISHMSFPASSHASLVHTRAPYSGFGGRCIDALKAGLFAFNAMLRLVARASSVVGIVREDFHLPIKQH